MKALLVRLTQKIILVRFYNKIIILSLLFLFITNFLYSQESNNRKNTIRATPFFIVPDFQGYSFTGFVFGYNRDRFILFEKYYADFEFTYSTLKVSDIEKASQYLEDGHPFFQTEVIDSKDDFREGNMISMKFGYRYILSKNFYYSLGFRITSINDPLYEHNYSRARDYPMKETRGIGPELTFVYRLNFTDNLFFDFGLGGTYNYTTHLVTHGQAGGMFGDWGQRRESYNWIKFWPKINLQIGYKFGDIRFNNIDY